MDSVIQPGELAPDSELPGLSGKSNKLSDWRGQFAVAIAALLAGQQPDPDQTEPYGCSIVRQA